MNTPAISADQMLRIESLCNQYIREQRQMYPSYYDDVNDPAVANVSTVSRVHISSTCLLSLSVLAVYIYMNCATVGRENLSVTKFYHTQRPT